MAASTASSRRPVALVTGASSGIGAELAREAAKDGHDVVLVARRRDAMQTLAEKLEGEGATVTVIPADLGEAGAAAALAQELAVRGIELDVLINAAGLGDSGRFDRAAPETIAAMLQVNVVALTELTRLVLPQMVARQRGKIMLVASTAAFQPRTANGGVLREQGLCAEFRPRDRLRAAPHRRHRHDTVSGSDSDRICESRANGRLGPIQRPDAGDAGGRGGAAAMLRSGPAAPWSSPGCSIGSSPCRPASRRQPCCCLLPAICRGVERAPAPSPEFDRFPSVRQGCRPPSTGQGGPRRHTFDPPQNGATIFR